MGVTRTHGIPGLPGNNNFKVMYAGAKKLGYKDVHTGRMAINSVPRARPRALHAARFLLPGLQERRQVVARSTPRSRRPRPPATSSCAPQSHVVKIEHSDAGKVTAVVYMDKDGKEQRQKARAVCVAGNSIETPRLLLLSASAKFPDGLANSSGQVGRNYMRHMTGSVYAAFKQPVNMYRGTTMAGIIRDESGHDTKRGFVGGYEMETLALGVPFMAAFLDPGAWGPEFAWWMDSYTHLAGMWLVGEDMPRESNRITLNKDAKDQYGLPAPNVHFDDHPNDIAMRNHAFAQGEKVYQAAGAVRTFRTPPYPSTHNLGTCRMSAQAKDGVVQQVGPDARHRQPVHQRRQPVHHRRRGEPDADDRHAGDPAGRLHCAADERSCDLKEINHV